MRIELDTWDKVRKWSDETGSFPPSYVEQINSGLYPKDAFSLGQVVSKIWLMAVLQAHQPPVKQVAILGCWIGSLVPLLHKHFAIQRTYGFDLDPEAVAQSEKFNRMLVEDNWKYKGVVADASQMDTSNMEFQTGGELIQVKPDWLINTSCEHMDTNWFETADTDQLIIMQTNNSPDFAGHINTCKDMQQVEQKYPLSTVLFSGELVTPVYTRFMQIGYK